MQKTRLSNDGKILPEKAVVTGAAKGGQDSSGKGDPTQTGRDAESIYRLLGHEPPVALAARQPPNPEHKPTAGTQSGSTQDSPVQQPQEQDRYSLLQFCRSLESIVCLPSYQTVVGDGVSSRKNRVKTAFLRRDISFVGHLKLLFP